MARVKTTKINGGTDYAKVADRLKLFWEENPNGKIETERENLPNNKIRFIARIWRNGNDVTELIKTGASLEVIKLSANSTASADATKKGDKENEKLETVAVGRALAMLGYLASGEVASREEMEQFEEFKNQKVFEEIEKAIDDLMSAKTLEELRDVFVSLRPEVRANEKVIETKDSRKADLEETK